MPTRRQAIAAGVALVALPAAGAAQVATARRPNPMPDALRRAIERDPDAPVLGNPAGDITLTEFFDYNCPHCRTMAPVMRELIGADRRLRVVFREWPVFGEGSVFAARAALAAMRQGRYWPMHSALMALRGRAAEAPVVRIARSLGLDEARLRRDMESEAVEAHIATSFELAEHMSLMGTPTLIAGDEAVFGEQSPADLRALLARARKTLG
ncbi:DsbA family protein [Paracoccus contaminans]|uniref:Fis family transcriptional regulator n=1 Tax=Paracoccus contaminans TaxID=1945662 RepID=A0A1W6CVG7_9RHOB|nr:DsbA family protein [Paracoccus contaminans]ARJ68789.1 Fis family transcriptional regulator [Paracoccus contaminans]